jgi:hypothetical protein
MGFAPGYVGGFGMRGRVMVRLWAKTCDSGRRQNA